MQAMKRTESHFIYFAITCRWALLFAIPLTALGYAIYPQAVQSGFAIVLLLVPFAILDLSPMRGEVNWIAFLVTQFLYYFFIVLVIRLARVAFRKKTDVDREVRRA